MRQILVWSDRLLAPDLPEVSAPAPTAPDGLADRADAPVSFDPESGLTRDGDTVYLTARVGPEAFDGSLVAPEALLVRVYDPEAGEFVVEGRTAVKGPGPIAVPFEVLIPGSTYQFDLIAEYPDRPTD